MTIRERGRGQFAQARQSEALQEHFSRRKAQPTIGAGEFLYELETAKRRDESPLVGIEEPVDFRLTDWLLECDAGEHFERGCRETRDAVASVLFTSNSEPKRCC